MEKKLTKWIGAFVFAALLIILYKVLDNFTEIKIAFNNFIHAISPFLTGILISYLLYIPCRKLESLYDKSKIKFIKKRGRALSILSVYLLFVLIIVLIIKFAVPVVYQNLADLVGNIPTYYNSMIESANNIPEDSILNDLGIKERLVEFSKTNFMETISLENIGQYLKSIMGVVGGLFNMIISIAVSVYVLIERRSIVRFLDKLTKALFEKHIYQTIQKYFNKTNEIFFTFIGSKGLDGVINWIVITVVLSLMSVKYAFLFGIIGGVLSLIPYFGSLISTIVISVITIFTGGITQAAIVLVLLVIFQQIDANVIEPKIMRNSLKISPLLIIFSVIVGRTYFGVIGMFLGVPVMTVLKLMLTDYIEFRQKQKNIKVSKTS